ncbi:MAG: hypothetical protein HY258_02960 [Chloroflexi bacterium]|nr:hypothetical protein [Chloroflexota bacterium]
MNSTEAKQILSEELGTYQTKPYAELVQSIDETVTCVKKGVGGKQYQLEVLVLWDSNAGGAIRVIGSIDDGGWRAFFPITDSILIEADKPK